MADMQTKRDSTRFNTCSHQSDTLLCNICEIDPDAFYDCLESCRRRRAVTGFNMRQTVKTTQEDGRLANRRNGKELETKQREN